MTRLGRWVRDRIEGVLQKFYEGPEPPARLEKMVHAFAELHPHATRGEWAAFAAAHAGEAYKSGYTRGYEHIERDRESWWPEVSPDDVMDQVDPDWRWGEAFRVDNPDRVVPEAFADDEVLRDHLDDMHGRHQEKR